MTLARYYLVPKYIFMSILFSIKTHKNRTHMGFAWTTPPFTIPWRKKTALSLLNEKGTIVWVKKKYTRITWPRVQTRGFDNWVWLPIDWAFFLLKTLRNFVNQIIVNTKPSFSFFNDDQLCEDRRVGKRKWSSKKLI